MNRPHLIQILSDEHCGLVMSCMGHPDVRTPNIDRMAAGGVAFERGYANCPVCTPSRGTIFSGRHAHAGPVPGFFDAWKVSAPSTATLLSEAGYQTAYFGKWHCGIVQDQIPLGVASDPSGFPGKHHRTPEDRRAGFEEWSAFECINAPFDSFYYKNDAADPIRMEGYQTDVLTDLAIGRIRSHTGPGPLYLVLSVEPPHFPLQVPEQFKRWDPASLTLRDNCDDTPQRRQEIADYYAMIENLDWNIGRLLNSLEEMEEFRGGRTCVSYISDHGELMGSHGLFCRKEYPYEEAIRIPAVFYWPEHIPARGLVEGLFSLVDFAPTWTALGGVRSPAWMQGHDWSARLLGKSQEAGPTDVLLEMTESPMWTPAYLNWRGFTDGRWKYAFYENRYEELFDLESDPFEQSNLASGHPELPRFRQHLLAMLHETREPFFDVIIEHGAAPPERGFHFPPEHSDMGLPTDWTGPLYPAPHGHRGEN